MDTHSQQHFNPPCHYSKQKSKHVFKWLPLEQRTQRPSPERQSGRVLPEIRGSWVPLGRKINIAGKAIPGTIFTASETTTSSVYLDPVIYTDLEVDFSSSESHLISGPSLDSFQWSYSSLSPQQRGEYLSWLSRLSTVPQKNVSESYVLLFLLGLEARFFWYEGDPRENVGLIHALVHLAKVYRKNMVIHGALQKFTDVANILSHDLRELQPTERICHSSSLPLSLRFVLGQMIKHNVAISWPWAMSFCQSHPETKTPKLSLEEQNIFKRHFKDHYQNFFPEGIMLKPLASSTVASYESVSKDYEIDFSDLFEDVPDINLYHDFAHIMLSLAKKAWEASLVVVPVAPAPTWQETATKKVREFYHKIKENSWTVNYSEETPLLLRDVRALSMEVGEVCESLGLEDSSTLEPKYLQLMSEELAKKSIILTPDPYLVKRALQKTDTIVFYDLESEELDLETQFQKMRQIFLFLELGCLVAHGDGKVMQEEKAWLHKKVSSSSLEKVAKIRLHTNLEWVLQNPADMAKIKNDLSTLEEVNKEQICRFIIETAAADNWFDLKGELHVIREIFAVLEVSEEHIFHYLAQRNQDTKEEASSPEQESASANVIPFPSKAAESREDVEESKDSLHSVLSRLPEGATDSHREPENVPSSLDAGDELEVGESKKVMITSLSDVEEEVTQMIQEENTEKKEFQRTELPPLPQSAQSRVEEEEKFEDYSENLISRLLSDTFRDEAMPTLSSYNTSGGLFHGLDARHGKFLAAILSLKMVPLYTVHQLAAEHNLMERGVIETLNSWCDEHYGEILLDFISDEEGYEVNADVVDQIRLKGAA